MYEDTQMKLATSNLAISMAFPCNRHALISLQCACTILTMLSSSILAPTVLLAHLCLLF